MVNTQAIIKNRIMQQNFMIPLLVYFTWFEISTLKNY